MKLAAILVHLNPVAIPGALLILIGLWGILARQNLFKIAVAFSILGTGVNLVILSVGYIRGRTAPILDAEAAVASMTDPVPQALVLTAIVIGLAVTALMLSYAVRLRSGGGGSSIEAHGDEKW